MLPGRESMNFCAAAKAWIPACAGMTCYLDRVDDGVVWTPAYAGMTLWQV